MGKNKKVTKKQLIKQTRQVKIYQQMKKQTLIKEMQEVKQQMSNLATKLGVYALETGNIEIDLRSDELYGAALLLSQWITDFEAEK